MNRFTATCDLWAPVFKSRSESQNVWHWARMNQSQCFAHFVDLSSNERFKFEFCFIDEWLKCRQRIRFRFELFKAPLFSWLESFTNESFLPSLTVHMVATLFDEIDRLSFREVLIDCCFIETIELVLLELTLEFVCVKFVQLTPSRTLPWEWFRYVGGLLKWINRLNQIREPKRYLRDRVTQLWLNHLYELIDWELTALNQMNDSQQCVSE